MVIMFTFLVKILLLATVIAFESNVLLLYQKVNNEITQMGD